MNVNHRDESACADEGSAELHVRAMQLLAEQGVTDPDEAQYVACLELASDEVGPVAQPMQRFRATLARGDALTRIALADLARAKVFDPTEAELLDAIREAEIATGVTYNDSKEA